MAFKFRDSKALQSPQAGDSFRLSYRANSFLYYDNHRRLQSWILRNQSIKQYVSLSVSYVSGKNS